MLKVKSKSKMFAAYKLTSSIIRGAPQYTKLTIRNIGAIRNSVTSCNRNLFLKIQPKVRLVTAENILIHQ